MSSFSQQAYVSSMAQLSLPTPAGSFYLDEATSLTSLASQEHESEVFQRDSDLAKTGLSKPREALLFYPNGESFFEKRDQCQQTSQGQCGEGLSKQYILDTKTLEDMSVPTPLQSPLGIDRVTSPPASRRDSMDSLSAEQGQKPLMEPALEQPTIPCRYNNEFWADTLGTVAGSEAKAILSTGKHNYSADGSTTLYGTMECPRASPKLNDLHVIEKEVDEDLEIDGTVLGVAHPLEPPMIGPHPLQSLADEMRWF